MKVQPEATSRRRREPSGRGQLRLISDPGRAGGHSNPSLPRKASSQPAELVRPSLTHGIEPFINIAKELPGLFHKHWDELEHDGFGLPLNPDWDLMFDMAQLGRLHVNTARYGKALVGYIFNFVLPNIYTREVLQGQVHLLYLHPAYRGDPWFVMEWLRSNDRFLESLGCRKILAMTKTGFRAGKVGALFRRLGYTKVEDVWARMI